MPLTWHDRHAVNKMEDEEQRDFYRRIVADKKPYFMRYIYPALMKQYNTYIKNTDRNALRQFGIRVADMRSAPYSELNEQQREFLRYYDYRMPVGTNDCVMNRICRRFEEEFDSHVKKHNERVTFDYSIMRGDAEYTPFQYQSIKKLHDAYCKQIRNYAVVAGYERIDDIETLATLTMLNDEFRKQCAIVCPDREELSSIILDICYRKSSTKKFAWEMCGAEIIKHLLDRNGQKFNVPVSDATGDFEYCGDRYKCLTLSLGDDE